MDRNSLITYLHRFKIEIALTIRIDRKPFLAAIFIVKKAWRQD